MATAQERELAALRAMPPAAKLATARTLWQQAWDLTAAGVRWRHPNWTEEQVTAEVRASFGRDAA